MSVPRAYPLPPFDGDPRFTLGLAIHGAAVLTVHGFPSVSGGDIVALQLALFRFLYAAPVRSADAAQLDRKDNV